MRTKALTRIKVVCPQCGPQEHRGYIRPDAEVPKEGVSRHVDPNDDRCPKCCSETLPNAAEITPLGMSVNVASKEFFEKEAAANFRREFVKNRRGLRVVIG